LMDENRGFAKGFDEYHLVRHDRWHAGVPPESEFSFAPARRITSEALAWLRRVSTPDSDVPFFVYLHYMETHTPLLCAESAGDRCKFAAAALSKRLIGMHWNFNASEMAIIRSLYDVGVARMDAARGWPSQTHMADSDCRSWRDAR
jgi:hypothetical protein